MSMCCPLARENRLIISGVRRTEKLEGASSMLVRLIEPEHSAVTRSMGGGAMWSCSWREERGESHELARFDVRHVLPRHLVEL